MRETQLILSDLRRTIFRTSAVVVSVAVLVSLLYSTSVLRVGSANASLSGSEKFGADLMIIPPLTSSIFSYETATAPILVVGSTQGYINGTLVGVARHLAGVMTATPQLFVANLTRPGSSAPYSLVAFDPKTDLVIQAWYAGSVTDLANDQALAGPATGFSAGDRVSYGNLSLTVAGVLKATNSSLDSTVLFPIQGANGGQAPRVSAILLKFTPDASLTTVEKEIVASLGVVKLVEASGLVSRVTTDTTGLASYELLAESIVALSLFLMMLLVFSMTTNERARQLGVLRSLGATNRFIFGNVLKEAALTAVLGSALGLVLGEIVVAVGQSFLFANFNTPVLSPGFWETTTLLAISASLGILTGTAASAIPAYRVTKRDPYEAIRRGE